MREDDGETGSGTGRGRPAGERLDAGATAKDRQAMGAKKSKANKTDTPDFEAAMAELDDVVRRLEAGDQPLEESLAAFEKGVGLVKALHARLDAVQARIDELTQGADGAAVLTPIDDDGEDDDR